ncbi:MAG: DUF5320 domain-containing protein [Candidatus Fermentibacteria bacterium]
MPAGNGTGPRSEGPLTGRATGRCSGYPDGGYATAPGRRGGSGFFGRRGGGGRGMRNRFNETGLPRWRRYPQYDRQVYNGEPAETESLKNQVQFAADAIEQIASRVNQLLKRKTEKE